MHRPCIAGQILHRVPGAHDQERPCILGGVPSTVAEVVIFTTQISRESGFHSSGCCKSPTSRFSYDLPLFFETFVRLFKKPILRFLTIYPTVQRRLRLNKNVTKHDKSCGIVNEVRFVGQTSRQNYPKYFHAIRRYHPPFKER